MAELAYNNAKTANTGHTLFELNCGYHPYVSFEENTNPCSQSKTADELSTKLRELITVCRENLYYAQKLQKQANNKDVKPRSYAPSEKVWLNSKYIKTKRNQKLEAKFFEPFQVLYPIGKQVYGGGRGNPALFWSKNPQYSANYTTISTIYDNSFAL